MNHKSVECSKCHKFFMTLDADEETKCGLCRPPHPEHAEGSSLGEFLKRIPCTKDGKPILWGDTVYIADPDGDPWEDGYVLPLKVESIMIGCHFKEYDGTHTIMGGDNECGNLECYSTRELVPVEY